MPRHPSEYGNLLRDLIAKHNVDCWLVNTGWTGGAYGVGNRMPIKETRGLLSAALDGRGTWADTAAYDAQAQKLVGMFISNFEQFAAHVDQDVRDAAPLAG